MNITTAAGLCTMRASRLYPGGAARRIHHGRPRVTSITSASTASSSAGSHNR